tara:strand:- start:540 stop:740 length:201 start_codon:yes stop_codon:yes gene_type:complete
MAVVAAVITKVSALAEKASGVAQQQEVIHKVATLHTITNHTAHRAQVAAVDIIMAIEAQTDVQEWP